MYKNNVHVIIAIQYCYFPANLNCENWLLLPTDGVDGDGFAAATCKVIFGKAFAAAGLGMYAAGLGMYAAGLGMYAAGLGVYAAAAGLGTVYAAAAAGFGVVYTAGGEGLAEGECANAGLMESEIFLAGGGWGLGAARK